jgi:hypothetical protein
MLNTRVKTFVDIRLAWLILLPFKISSISGSFNLPKNLGRQNLIYYEGDLNTIIIIKYLRR